MDPASALSQGALEAIFHDTDKAAKLFPVPVMQCLQVKQMAPSAQGGDRYRLVMSDGRHFVQTMLATQANHVVHDNKLVRGCFARVKQYSPNNLKGKNILVIIDLEVIDSLGVQEKIGEPVTIDSFQPPQENTISGGDFYGVKKEEESKPQAHANKPQTMASRPPATHGGNTISPIEAVSPFTHKWTIRARVTSKSDIKRWHKAGGNEGKLFSVNLLDESGEIKATGFNEQCDTFFDVFQEGAVYYISGCRVNMAKKQFSNIPNDYELAFERDSIVEKAEDQSNVPQVKFNFCTIQELQGVEKDNTVDVIGVLKTVDETNTITSKKDGRSFNKRDLTLVDDTGMSVRVTVWGKTADSFDTPVESVIAFKGTKVSDFNGKSLSLLSSGTMSVDPDIPDAHRLKGWYDSTGRNESFATHQNLASVGSATGRKDEIKTIGQVKEENLGVDDTAYYSTKATVVYIKQEPFCYAACASENCNKKVVDMGDGQWRCENCNINHDKPEYRYILSVNVADHTSHQWLSCFDDTARTIIGHTANEMVELRDNDHDQFVAVFDKANCHQYNFRCRAKMDNYGEAQRIRYQAMKVQPVDFKAEGDRLAELIKQYQM